MQGKKKTTEEFIADAKAIHRDRYNYSKVIYTGSYNKIEIICPIHGIFIQNPTKHLEGRGCIKCAGNERKTTRKFITEAKAIHGDKYDYSKVAYINSNTKVEIICSIHGSFWQKPTIHINNGGCLYCAREKKASENEILLRKLIQYDYPFLSVIGNYREHPELDGREIDIWIPEINLGIEWNGKYWHSPEWIKKVDRYKKSVMKKNLLQIIDEGNKNKDFVLSTYNLMIKPKIQERVQVEHLFS